MILADHVTDPAARSDISIIAIHGRAPRIDPSAFIASGCRIIGDVEIGPEASIWYNCVLRADVSSIRIGARSNIQDGTIVHCDGPVPGRDDGYPTIIGDDVLIGHQAIIHGCAIADRGFVGMGAVVMNACHIDSDAMLAAGAMLTPGKTLPSGELWAGRPARLVRALDEAALMEMRLGVAHYVMNGQHHKAALDG